MIIAILYLAITGTVTIRVGHNLYKNGIHYLQLLFEEHMALSLNKLLLLGYYLLNLGLIVFTAATWPTLQTLENLIAALSFRTGLIILLLGAIHCGNLVWLAIYSAYRRKYLNQHS